MSLLFTWSLDDTTRTQFALYAFLSSKLQQIKLNLICEVNISKTRILLLNYIRQFNTFMSKNYAKIVKDFNADEMTSSSSKKSTKTDF